MLESKKFEAMRSQRVWEMGGGGNFKSSKFNRHDVDCHILTCHVNSLGKLDFDMPGGGRPKQHTDFVVPSGKCPLRNLNTYKYKVYHIILDSQLTDFV